ncbi:basic proline-rich protein-like [Panthera pardus]|uniref:Basic proline-rich protein-like n=1 Tax=Panthera pardus TaxID=9691 RepID=A0A9W2V5S0_PANPR|nr:basic proline-rich protein-like [Panthera pardus]
MAQYVLGVASLPSVLSPDLLHHDIKPKDGSWRRNSDYCLGSHLPEEAPGTRGSSSGTPARPPPAAPLGGPPVTRPAARVRPAADPPGVRGARRLHTRRAPSPRRLPAAAAAAARRLRAPSRLSPRRGRAGPGRAGGAAGAGGDGAAIVPQPLPGAQEGLAGRGGRAAAEKGGLGVPSRCASAPPASSRGPPPRGRGPPPPAARAAFVTVPSPSEPARRHHRRRRRRRCARGCKWRPPASAPPAALPARGRLGAPRPGRIPPPPALRPQRGSRPVPAAPTPRPPSARAARSHLPRAAAHRRVARAGSGRIPGLRRGKYPLSKPLLCALKQVAPT